MQIFVKILASKSMSMEVESGQSVASLKAQLQHKQGIPKEEQRLIYGGKQMEDDRTLAAYNIHNQSTLFLSLRLRGGVGKLNYAQKLLALARKHIQYKPICRNSETQLQHKQGIPKDEQRLIYGGKQMEDDRTLAAYNIHNQSTLFLSLRLRGGVGKLNYAQKLLALARKYIQYKPICRNSETQLQHKQGIPKDEQRLIFGGKQMVESKLDLSPSLRGRVGVFKQIFNLLPNYMPYKLIHRPMCSTSTLAYTEDDRVMETLCLEYDRRILQGKYNLFVDAASCKHTKKKCAAYVLTDQYYSYIGHKVVPLHISEKSSVWETEALVGGVIWVKDNFPVGKLRVHSDCESVVNFVNKGDEKRKRIEEHEIYNALLSNYEVVKKKFEVLEAVWLDRGQNFAAHFAARSGVESNPFESEESMMRALEKIELPVWMKPSYWRR